MTTPESKVKEKIKALLKKHSVWYYLPVSMGMGQHGIPDFICCAKGKFLGIEAKAEGKVPTALQVMQMNKIEAAGGETWVEDGTTLVPLENLIKEMAT
jgi:hypothetical protein